MDIMKSNEVIKSHTYIASSRIKWVEITYSHKSQFKFFPDRFFTKENPETYLFGFLKRMKKIEICVPAGYYHEHNNEPKKVYDRYNQIYIDSSFVYKLDEPLDLDANYENADLEMLRKGIPDYFKNPLTTKITLDKNFDKIHGIRFDDYLYYKCKVVIFHESGHEIFYFDTDEQGKNYVDKFIQYPNINLIQL